MRVEYDDYTTPAELREKAAACEREAKRLHEFYTSMAKDLRALADQREKLR